MLMPIIESAKETESLIPTQNAEGAQPKPNTDGADKGYDKTVSISKSPSILDLMREITGEPEDKEFRPLLPEIENRDDEPQGTVQPEKQTEGVKPKPEAQPKADSKGTDPQGQQPKKFVVGGVEFTDPDALAKSYAELHKEFHKRNFEHKSDLLKRDAEISHLDSEKKFLEQMMNQTVIKAVQGGGTPVQSSEQSSISKEKFEAMLESGQTLEAVQEIVNQRMEGNRQELEALRKTSEIERSKTQAQMKQDQIRRAIQAVEEDPEVQSFKENRTQFGGWLEELYGSDTKGLESINELCTEPARIKRTYRTFLKDTYDFTKAMQSAQAEGQSVAAQKERLQPIQTRTSNPQQDKKPDDKSDPVMEMETFLGIGKQKGSYFGKGNLFR